MSKPRRRDLSYRRTILTTDDEGYPSPYSYWSRGEIIRMDIAFCEALIKARRKGTEISTPIGIIVDDSPMVPTHYGSESKHSMIGSSAQFCADNGFDSAGQGYGFVSRR